MNIFKILLNDTELNLPIRQDGFVNSNILFKTGGKKFKHWYRTKKEFNNLIKPRASSIESLIPSSMTYSKVTVRRGAILALSRQASIN